jgi:hypothetical protein
VAVLFRDGIINVHVAIIQSEVIIFVETMLTAAQSATNGGPDGDDGPVAITMQKNLEALIN